MDTLTDMIEAVVILGQIILAVRIIICWIKECNYESNEVQNFKKQRRQAAIALIVIACVYDIPKIIEYYFSARKVIGK